MSRKLLTSNEFGNIALNQLSEQRKLIVERWEKTGLLKGLDDYKKTTIAQLLENQAKEMLKEASNTTSDVMGFDQIVFPLVRRVFSRLLANEIVSVQPLNLPSGLLFYIDHLVTASPGGAFSSVYDAHYSNSGWTNSLGTPTVVDFQVGGTPTRNATINSTTRIALVPYSGGVAGLSSLRIATMSALTDNTSGVTQYVINPQTWTQDLFSQNIVSVTVPINTPGGYAAVSAMASWNTYASLENTSAMSEVKLVVSSVTVNVRSRKMKASWTPELAQDLQAYHSLDAEAELTSLLSEEVAAEIDREIIRDLINVATYQTAWPYARNGAVTAANGTVIAGDSASGYITQKEWNQTLLTQINKVSNAIHKATLRGGANWVLCSTEVASVIDDIERFHGVNESDAVEFSLGIEKLGSLDSRYKVYKDPYLPDWVCLIGRKGTTFMEAGYVYAPYIPFQVTPTILEPNDFTPRKGLMTRYATKVVNNKYYGLVKVTFPASFNIINRP
jgi:hypothetical protein